MGLFCSCVKIADPAAIPANEMCFYVSVLVSRSTHQHFENKDM